MSDGWGNTTAVTTAKTSDGLVEGKAPWIWLGLGAFLAMSVWIASIFIQPNGESAALGYLVFWVISMAAYLIPFAGFVVGDLRARSTSLIYRSDPKSVSAVRSAYLLFGLLMSSIFVYFLADELSRLFNVVN